MSGSGRPSIIVQKYGGSSVADVERLQAIAHTVVARQRGGERLVVVVSAMGKTTDQLIAQARKISLDPPRRELDMLVTAGERITMALLSMAIHQAGEQAISFTGSQSGIITDEQHQGARILEVRAERLHQALEAGRIIIVAGYQGVSRSREVTTLGRGGSDTTAVALAAALQADACEIYSDVDGVYTADPNVCAQAQLLPQIGYSLMHAMAGAGARVLNADAVEFARRAGITIVARKTGDTSGRQTRVSAQAETPVGVAAVVGSHHASLLTGAMESVPENFWVSLSQMGARVVALGPQAVLVDRTGVPGRDAAHLGVLAQAVELRASATGVLSLLGTSLLGVAAARLRQLLREAGLGYAGCFGTDTCLSVILPDTAVDDAVRLVHQSFVTA